jgi:hypothetical protein
MVRFQTLLVCVGILAGFAGARAAMAATLTFQFGALSNGAGDAAIQDYMESLLPPGASVVVTGATASNDYNADGYVTGPLTVHGTGGSKTYTENSFTLANLDPSGNGTFIMNNNLASTPVASRSSEIELQFAGLTVSSLSFDLEIFPNMYCTALTATDCGGSGKPDLPDLAVKANGALVATYLGVTPGKSAASEAGTFPDAYTYSPASGHGAKEEAPQLIGSSALLDAPAGTEELEFVDWYPEIGINDLVINYTPLSPPTPPAVPEPNSLMLLGGALVAGFGMKRFSKSR